MMRWIATFLLSLILFCMSAYSECTTDAPIADAWAQPLAVQGHITVAKGETLYSIAFRYGRDYRELAAMNHLYAPYALEVGQKLSLVPVGTAVGSKLHKDGHRGGVTKSGIHLAHVGQLKNNRAKTLSKLEAQNLKKSNLNTKNRSDKKNTGARKAAPVKLSWGWPSKGHIIKSFSLSQNGNKGIDIAGTLGSPVHAAASGKVVYSGSGLRGYGNLIMIKNNDDFLSAYAHNRKNLVIEGDLVQRGQRIATMGRSGAKRIELHFEIRRAGKPVNPMRYLPKR